MATVKRLQNLNILSGITYSVIPESAGGGYPESRKRVKWISGYRITARPCPVWRLSERWTCLNFLLAANKGNIGRAI